MLLTGLPFLVVGAVLALVERPRCSTRSPSATTSPAGSAGTPCRDRLVLGLAVRAAGRRRHRAGRPDRLRRPDRPARVARGRRARTTAGSCPSRSGTARSLVVAGRHRRPGRAAADRGAGRDHDRGRRRAGVPVRWSGAAGWGRCDDRAGPSTARLGATSAAAASAVRRAATAGAPPPAGRRRAVAAPARRCSPRGCCSATSRSRSPTSSGSCSARRSRGRRYILMESKLPRAVLGVLVGAAFGVGGAIFQTTLRNPLASPDIIGVSLGASAAAVFAIVTPRPDRAVRSRSPPSSAPSGLGRWCALVAGPDGAGYRLVLVGVGVAAALAVGHPVPLHPRRRLRRPAGPALADRQRQRRRLADDPAARRCSCSCCCRSLVWLARSLRITELGDDAAAGLGVTPRRTDALLLLAVLLDRGRGRGRRAGRLRRRSSPARSPGRLNARPHHPARCRAWSARSSSSRPTTSRDYLIADINLPVGVVTGAFGAPFLLWLLARGRTGRRAA